MSKQLQEEKKELGNEAPLADVNAGGATPQNYPTLRSANVARQAAWCPEQSPDLSFRGNELAGETGEVCNVIKKLERARQGWRGSRDTKEHLAEELADVVICADLIGVAAGIDLERAVVEKFNATSIKVGLPHRLAPGGSNVAVIAQNQVLRRVLRKIAKAEDMGVMDCMDLAGSTLDNARKPKRAQMKRP